MEKKAYLTDGLIGNSKILATMKTNGELVRFWWPHITNPQHIDKSFGGVFIKGVSKKTIWQNDKNITSVQNYQEDTNILITEGKCEKYKFEIKSCDFAVANGDSLVRCFRVYNHDNVPREMKFMYYSSFQTNDSKLYSSAYFDFDNDSIVHYKHKYCFAIGSDLTIDEFTTENAFKDAEDGRLEGAQCSLTNEGAIGFNLGVINPGEYKEVVIYISAGFGREEAISELNNIKNRKIEEVISAENQYWKEYLSKTRKINVKNEKIEKIYTRSLLVFKLLTDKSTGAIAAAPEVDEAFEMCGGYGYCWGRDAAYIGKAFDKTGLTDMSKAFFNWSKNIQEKNGSFEQRHHMDGTLAPAWGLQVDETGSILWGIYGHYEETKDMEFLKSMRETIKKGADFLIGFIDKDTNLPKPSMDLWEERKGEHLYSAAAVYGGLIAASKISNIFDESPLAEKYLEVAENIKIAIVKMGFKEKNNAFLRGIKVEVTEETYNKLVKENKETSKEIGEKGYVKYYESQDEIFDISILGLSEPFNIIDAKDEKMISTAMAIEEKLWSKNVGGIRRYENDSYIGGNPWILTTLWLALYKIRSGELDRAKELLHWATEHSTENYLLPEQINKESGKPAWIIPLTWSHAMYVLTAIELSEKNLI